MYDGLTHGSALRSGTRTGWHPVRELSESTGRRSRTLSRRQPGSDGDEWHGGDVCETGRRSGPANTDVAGGTDVLTAGLLPSRRPGVR